MMVLVTKSQPTAGTRILVETKPFKDSAETRISECRIIKTDRLHWTVERKPGSRHCIPVETIQDWTEA